MSTKVVVDFSTFARAGGKEVLVKELSIVDVDSRCSQHWIFNPPGDSTEDWSRQDSWLSSHFHGLKYHTGFTEYEKLMPSLDFHCSEAKILFAPTKEKATFLEKLFETRRLVFDLETFGCPAPPRNGLFPETMEDDDLDECGVSCEARVNHRRPCLYHHVYAQGCACTLSSAMFAADWCANHPELINMNDFEVREKTFKGWTLQTPTTAEMAKSGFVRVSTTKDSTRCVYCKTELYKWEEGDDVDKDHEFNAPWCPFLRYKWQIKRSNREVGRHGHNKDGTTDFFFRRYGHLPDIDETDVFKKCNV